MTQYHVQNGTDGSFRHHGQVEQTVNRDHGLLRPAPACSSTSRDSSQSRQSSGLRGYRDRERSSPSPPGRSAADTRLNWPTHLHSPRLRAAHLENARAAFPNCAFSSLTSAKRMRQHPKSNQLCDACGLILTAFVISGTRFAPPPLVHMCLLANASSRAPVAAPIWSRPSHVASRHPASRPTRITRGWSGFCSSSRFNTSNASSRLPAAAYNSMTKVPLVNFFEPRGRDEGAQRRHGVRHFPIQLPPRRCSPRKKRRRSYLGETRRPALGDVLICQYLKL